MSYDSRLDTMMHQDEVRKKLGDVMQNLEQRGIRHDVSKLNNPEVGVFNEYTPKLKECTYGSEEYKEYLRGMQVALDHHYSSNRHHPEHHENGIRDMTLLDLLEMLADWKAATLRHDDGDLQRSLEINATRFNIPAELQSILASTARELGWIES